MPPRISDVNRFLTDALIELRSPRGWRPADEDLKAVVEYLEPALLERDMLRPVLRHLQSIRPPPPASGRGLTKAEELAVQTGGLMALYEPSPPRFFEAVSDPLLLLEMSELVLDDLSDYWWALVRRQDGTPPRPAGEILHRADAREPALAALDGPAAAHRWTRTAIDDRVVRLLPRNSGPPAVTVEFSLEAVGDGHQLRAELLAPVPLSGSRCVAVLLTVLGIEVCRYEGNATEIRLPLGAEASLDDLIFGCEYDREPEDRIRFAVAVGNG